MEFEQALKQRRTIRFYEQKAVSRDDVRDLLEAARVTSSAGNLQKLRYVVVQEPQLAEALFKETAYAALVKPRRNPVWGVTAPQTFIVVNCPAPVGPMNYADAGAAIQSMQLAATAKGLGCCWLGAINKPNIHKLLDLAETTEVLFVLAVGYPAESPVMETATSGVAYYLDEANTLHVPKLPVDAVTQWR